MMDVVELEEQFEMAKAIPDAVTVALRTLAYGYRSEARIMANILFREANLQKNWVGDKNHDPKPVGDERGAAIAKPYMDMIDELNYLVKRKNENKKESKA